MRELLSGLLAGLMYVAFLLAFDQPVPMPVVPIVSPGDSVMWDPHDQTSVTRTTHYETRVDSGAWIKVGLARRWKLPILDGEHMVYVRACFNTRCSAPAELKIRMLSPEAIPETPMNFLPICRMP